MSVNRVKFLRFNYVKLSNFYKLLTKHIYKEFCAGIKDLERKKNSQTALRTMFRLWLVRRGSSANFKPTQVKAFAVFYVLLVKNKEKAFATIQISQHFG